MSIKKLNALSKPYGFDYNNVIKMEADFNIKLPQYFIKFIELYGGTRTKESIYDDNYHINIFLPLQYDGHLSIYSTLKGCKDIYGVIEWLPFAIDSGGWTYCIALRDDIKNQVWINADEPVFDFVFVSDSFESFINKLKTEDE
jgi:cell wall assembly regulator SMI1